MDNSKRALVTGSGARVGKALAESLGQKGWQVAVHYRTTKTGALDTVDTIRQAGGKAELVQGDLSIPDDRDRLVSDAMEALGGPLTLLVNSASTFEDDSAKSFTEDDWDFHFGPNVRAPLILARNFANALPSDMKGQIINLIDQRVLKLNPQFFTYTLSKSLLWTATRTLAQSLAPNIRVNAIAPGPVLGSIHQTDDVFAAEKKATLTGEGSSPEQIVHTLHYLIEASTVTGQMICSDGGQHLLWQTPDLEV